MPLRLLTDRHAVSPQIGPDDLPALRREGVAAILCNRPDGEVPPALSSARMEAACAAEGLPFAVLPALPAEMGPALAERQREAVAQLARSAGPEGVVLAYCASGTRCATLWALGEAGRRPPEEILERAAKAGYDLGHLLPHLG